MSKRLLLLLVAVMALLTLVGVVTVTASPAAEQAATVTVAMSGTIGGGGREIEYTITVNNGTTSAIGNLYIAGAIPESTTFASATATPTGAAFLGAAGGVVQWGDTSIAAGAKKSYSFKVNVTHAPAGASRAWVRWRTPSEGSASSADVTWAAAVAAGAPRRGCTACHVVIDPVSGRYSLLYEAKERAEVRGGRHPTVALDGRPMTNDTPVDTCLQCHKPGTGVRAGKGAAAPLALRDIVHPAHMFSSAFVERYGGGCFTCHNVAGDGSFELLGQKVDVNEKGIPNPAKLPIPGAIPPSEGKR